MKTKEDTALELEKENDMFHQLCTPIIKLGEKFEAPDWYAWVYGGEKSPCITGEKPRHKSPKTNKVAL